MDLVICCNKTTVHEIIDCSIITVTIAMNYDRKVHVNDNFNPLNSEVILFQVSSLSSCLSVTSGVRLLLSLHAVF